MLQVSILANMTSAPASPDSLSIFRHCIQQCLHGAMQAEQQSDFQPYLGLLGGSDHGFTAVLQIPATALSGNPAPDSMLCNSVASFCQRFALSACFVTRDSRDTASDQLRAGLTRWLDNQGLSTPSLYAELEMTHAGRLEIHCYAADGREIPLSMQEDGSLYPQSASH